jgi:hypothetical protein
MRRANTSAYLIKIRGGSYTVVIVIYSYLNIFFVICLRNMYYGASEYINLCKGVEKIHRYFWSKMRQCF